MPSTPQVPPCLPSGRRIAIAARAVSVALTLALLSTAATGQETAAGQAKAEEIAASTLEKILAEAAAPELANGTRLKPYQVDGLSKLPTTETTETYLAPTPENGIFWLREPRQLPENRLVRTSEGGTPAFTASKWAYAGQEQNPAFQPEQVPQWMDYTDPQTGAVIGRVAYAIWDESGKLDINMAGRDGLTAAGEADPARVNGLAPHDLQFEQLSLDSDHLLTYLNGADGQRNRSNFSMRNIARDESAGTGDDRRFFTTRELLEKGRVRPEFEFDVGVSSRDFEMKPEWDGNREALAARSFLRTFVNNGRFFRFINHPKAGARLVLNTLDERQLRAQLRSVIPITDIGNDEPEWLSFMRMLAILRRAYPFAGSFSGNQFPLPLERLANEDIYALAVNIIQGTMRPNDENKLIYDSVTHGYQPFNDPNSRVGTRVTPYIVATTLRAKRISLSKIELTEYFKIWNPHAQDLSTENYYYGHWAGGSGTYSSYGPLHGNNVWFYTKGPKAGEFKIVKLPTRTYDVPPTQGNRLIVRARPIIQHRDYYQRHILGTATGTDSVIYGTSNGPVYSAGGGDPSISLTYAFAPYELDESNSPGSYVTKWFSFEIDDPRMGGFQRWGATTPPYQTNMTYSWKGKPGQHSLYDPASEDGVPPAPTAEMDPVAWKAEWQAALVTSPYGAGYNSNFGENFPAEWTGSSADKLARALSTFALPRRQYLSLADSSRVFAQRPWSTLQLEKLTAALFDELSTLGTTSLDTNLAVKAPAEQPSADYHPDFAKRVRDNLWLFDSVDVNNNPAGNVRPIRGRISLNAVRPGALGVVLAAPYRMVGTLANGSQAGEDVYESITPAEALAVANDLAAIRPIRTLADLGRLKQFPGLEAISRAYPSNVAEAVLARLIQFGSVRQQTYTVEIISQTLDAANPGTVTGEARRLVTVNLDTYSRRTTILGVEAGARLPFALDAAGLTWTTDPARPWLGHPDAAAANGHVARSARVNPGESTWIEAVVNGPGELRFRQQIAGSVAGEKGDFLVVTLDDTLTSATIGSTAWTEGTLDIPPGSRRVRWTYTATHSRDDDEGAMVDNVSYVRVNNPPVAVADTGLFTGGPISVPVLGNDTDTENHGLTITNVTNGLHGTTSIQGTAVIYTPGNGFVGRDEFTYEVTDELGGSSVGTVAIRPASTFPFILAQTRSPLPGAGEPGGLPATAVVSSLGIPAFGADSTGGWRAIYRAGKVRGQAIVGGDGKALRLHSGSPVTDENGAPVSGVSFKSFGEPVFGASGDFAVLAKLRGAGIKTANDEGLWISIGGTLRRIAMEGAVAPEAGGATIKTIESVAIADSGSLYFIATLQRGYGLEKSNDRGLWAWAQNPTTPGEGSIKLLLREGALVEGFPAPLTSFHALSIVRGSEGEGRASAGFERLAVLASFDDGSQAITSLSASGEWSSVIRSGLQTAHPFTYLMLESLGVPDQSSDTGTLAFLTQVLAGGAAIADSGVGIVAESGTPAPGADGALFDGFAHPVADATGGQPHLAFIASLKSNTGGKLSNTTGVWRYDAEAQNPRQIVARQGDAAPGWQGAVLGKFLSVAMLPGRGPIFVATVKAKASAGPGKRGIWTLNNDGQLALVLREGQVIIQGEKRLTVRKFAMLSPVVGSGGQQRAMRDAAAITCRVDFTDGSQAILKIALP